MLTLVLVVSIKTGSQAAKGAARGQLLGGWTWERSSTETLLHGTILKTLVELQKVEMLKCPRGGHVDADYYYYIIITMLAVFLLSFWNSLSDF